MQLDQAMRQIFKSIRLPKEFQEIERIIEAFANEYFEQNRAMLLTQSKGWNNENVALLAKSILILNTTLHSEKVPKSLKLSKQSYVKTNRSILNDIVDENYLNGIYDRIQSKPFESKIDLSEKHFRR